MQYVPPSFIHSLTKLQAGVPNFFEKSQCFVYKRIPVYDASTSAFELLQKADEIVEFIARGLLRGAVLVHCNKGQSRSTTAALFYLLRNTDMSLDKALEMIQRRRPEVEPIPAFRVILKQYEAECFKEREASNDNSAVEKRRTKKKKQIVGPSMGPSAAGAATNNDDDVGGNNNNKRRRIGPPAMEPSIGPARGPTNIGPSLPPSSAISIGPAMPPPKVDEEVESIIGPALPPSSSTVTSIGPSMPPPKVEVEHETQSTNIGPSMPPSLSTAISMGPSMPPPKAEVEMKGTEANHQSIGPSLPSPPT